MSLEILEGPLLFFVETFLFFDPFFHLIIAVTSSGFFGKKRLSGFLHGENVVKDNDLIKFIGRETELIFDLDKAIGLEVFIKLIALFGSVLLRKLKAFKEVIDNLMKLNSIDGWLLLKDAGKMAGIDRVGLMDGEMFGDEGWGLVESGCLGLHGNYDVATFYI